MSETERIEILLQARDRDFHRALDRSNKLIARFERDAGRATTRSARAVEMNLSRMGGSIKAFAGGVVGGVLAAGIATVTSELAGTIKGIAAIGDEARRSGLGVDTFQELKFVAQQSRIPVEALIDGMKELSLRADEFVTTGQGSAADAFKRIGFDPKQLSEGLKEPRDLMLDIIDRMQDLDKAAQIRVSDEIFGGTGGERFVELLAQGDDGIRQMIGRAHELGAVLDDETVYKAAELDRKFGELKARLGGMGKAFAVGMADGIGEVFGVIDEVQDFIDRKRAEMLLGADVVESIEDATGATETQADKIREMNLEMDQLAKGASEFARVLADEIPQMLDLGLTDQALAASDLVDQINQLVGRWIANEISASDFRTELGKVAGEADTTVSAVAALDEIDMDFVVGQMGRLAQMLDVVASRARAAVAAMPKPAKDGVYSGRGGDPRVFVEGRTGPLAPSTSLRPRAAPSMTHEINDMGSKGGGKSPNEWAREVESTRDAIAQLEMEAASLLVVAEYGHELGDKMTYARKRAELLYSAQKAGLTITPELTAEVDALAQAYTRAGMDAEDAEQRMERLQDAAKTGADAISDLFLSVFDGSKSAKAAVADLLMEIARVQFRSGILGLGGGGGVFSFIGGLLSGKRAGGGPVEAGRAYLVNEDTPNSEVFVPGASGAILNVGQAQAALGGSASGRSGGDRNATFNINIEGANGDRHIVALVTQAVKRGMAEVRSDVPMIMSEHQKRFL